VNTEQAAASLFADLTPTELESSTYYSQDYLDFYKNFIPPVYTEVKQVPEYTEEVKNLILNVETTAVNPWESRLICIGVLDPSSEVPQILQFMEANEEATITEFVDWINSTGYKVLVGYNVSFDYRFLYALMQRYRLVCPAWPEMSLYDLMVQQKQVKQSFVSTTQKPGTLEQWATYLFGTQPYAEQAKVYEWLKAGNTQEILNFNEDKITKAYMLYTLNKVVAGTIIPATTTAQATSSAPQTVTATQYPSAGTLDHEMVVYCPTCHQEQYMPKGEKVANCFVCGTPIANPLL